MCAYLWRVRVHDVSSRLVEAETKEEAIALTREAVVEALDIQATRAEASSVRVYGSLSRRRQKQFLIAADALAKPWAHDDPATIRRQLARRLKYAMAERGYVHGRQHRPVDPGVLMQLLASSELRRIQRVRNSFAAFEDDPRSNNNLY